MPKCATFKRQGLNAIQDQGKEWACTAFATCNIINGFKEPKYKAEGLEWWAISGHDYFNLVNSTYPIDLQGALAPIQAIIYAKNNGYISMYQQLFIKDMTPTKFKKLLKAGFLFLVTMNKCDRTATQKSYVCTKKEFGGLTHSVALVDYDDKKELFKFVNSWGEERGDHGYFYMKYEDIQYFIDQIYAIYDSDDTQNMERLLYKTKLLAVVNTISEQRKRGTEDEKKAMNFANTMLRKVVLAQNHQYNMSKAELIDFINKNF